MRFLKGSMSAAVGGARQIRVHRPREPRPAVALSLHVPRRRPAAAGSSFTSGEGPPLPSAGRYGGAPPWRAEVSVGQGRWAPSHGSKGGGMVEDHPGGHGVGGCPPALAGAVVERQQWRAKNLGERPQRADSRRNRHLTARRPAAPQSSALVPSWNAFSRSCRAPVRFSPTSNPCAKRTAPPSFAVPAGA